MDEEKGKEVESEIEGASWGYVDVYGLNIQLHSTLVHGIKINGGDACPCGSQKRKSQKSHLHSEE